MDHKILDLHNKKLSNRQMEKELGVHRNTIHSRLRRMARKPHQMRQSQTTRSDVSALPRKYDPVTSKQVIQTGDIALMHTQWTVSGPHPMRVYAIEVARRQQDGTWCWLIGDPFTVSREIGF